MSTMCLRFKVCGRRGNGRAWDAKIKKMWSLIQGANSPVGELEACIADSNTSQAGRRNHRGINKVL